MNYGINYGLYNDKKVTIHHEGEDYVLCTYADEPDAWDYAIVAYRGLVQPWVDEPQVGDKVRLKAVANDWAKQKLLGDTYTLIYIHQIDERKFGVVAYGGDIPSAVWYKDLEKVE